MKWFKQLKDSLGRKEKAETAASLSREYAPVGPSPMPPTAPGEAPPSLAQADSDEARVASLSPREREVFEWLLAGKKQREIADLLRVRPTTVSFHCTALYKKLDIHDKAQLFLRYARFL